MRIDDPAQSVRMPPGSRTVTRIPSGATSAASTDENPPTAHFAVWYAPSDAQAGGLVTSAYTPVELLGLVLHVSGFWSAAVPEFGRLTDEIDPGRRREVVVRAVRALLAGP
jgi:hypothetical protein